MKLSSIAGVALVAMAGFGATANASIIPVTAEYEIRYGADEGRTAPVYGGIGTRHSDYVKVLDRDDGGGNRFYDLFDFSDFVYDTITSLTFSLTYSHAPQVRGLFLMREDWRVYLSTDGSTDSGTREDGGPLDSKQIATFTLTLNDGDVFDQAIASQQFSFWFGDEGSWRNDFRLYDAKLTLVGEVAPIPLPAAGLLLMGALGGLGLVRRRKSADKAA